MAKELVPIDGGGDDDGPTVFQPEPWERQVGETDRAFAAFRAYRDMGAERSLARVGRELGKTKGTVEGLSARNHWRERVIAWDIEVDRRDREHLEERRRQVNEAGLAAGSAALSRALERLIGKDSDGNPIKKLDSSKLEPGEVAALMREGAKLQRLSLGLATDISGTAEYRRKLRSLAYELTAMFIGRWVPEDEKAEAVSEAEAVCRRVMS